MDGESGTDVSTAGRAASPIDTTTRIQDNSSRRNSGYEATTRVPSISSVRTTTEHYIQMGSIWLTRLTSPGVDTAISTPSEDYRYPVVRAARKDNDKRPNPRTLALYDPGRVTKPKDPVQSLRDRVAREIKERRTCRELPSGSDRQRPAGYQAPRVEDLDDLSITEIGQDTQMQEEAEVQVLGQLSDIEF